MHALPQKNGFSVLRTTNKVTSYNQLQSFEACFGPFDLFWLRKFFS